MAKAKKGSWVVRMRCTVLKDVVVEGCTEEQAQQDPFEYAVDETEAEQEDYTVLKVDPNE